MNENSLKNLRPAWKPGESGNPNGRPTARSRLTERFIGDVAATWEQRGPAILQKMAPDRFADMCSRLIPRDVAISLEARLPGGLDAADLAILQAIKQGIPNANEMEPQAVLTYTLEAIRAHSGKLIEHDTPTTHDTKPLTDKD